MDPDSSQTNYSRFLHRGLLLWLLLITVPLVRAAGWSDFTRDIGDGYELSKMSSLEVCIGKQRGGLILCGRRGSDIGPVDAYLMTPDHIFARTWGRKPTTYSDGSVGETVDLEQQFYFVIEKQTDALFGPLSEAEFAQRPEVIAYGPLDWNPPTNSEGVVVLGVVGFVVIVVLLVLAAPVAIVALLILWFRRRGAARANQFSDPIT